MLIKMAEYTRACNNTRLSSYPDSKTYLISKPLRADTKRTLNKRACRHTHLEWWRMYCVL